MLRTQKINLACDLYDAAEKLIKSLGCEIAESNGAGIGVFSTAKCADDKMSDGVSNMVSMTIEQSILRMLQAIEHIEMEGAPCR